MSQHWRNVLLSLSAVTLLVTACKKTSSPDPSLTINYTPSIIISSDNYIVYGLNPVTGKKNWEYDGLHYPVQASPLIYNEMVYIATNGTDTIYKLNSKTGALVMKIVPDPNATFTVASTPIADNGLIYVAGSNSVLYAIDTGTGKPKWTYNTGTGVLADGTPIVSSPVIYNGKIYFATTGGGIYCLDKTNGGTLFSAPFTATPEVWTLPIPGASFTSSPAVAFPYLYIGSTIDSNMYCIYLNEPTIPAVGTGVIRWSYKTHGPINSSPAAYNGRCIFGCDDFNVYCLDTSVANPLAPSAGLIWKTSTNGKVTSSPFVDNQVVYIGNDNAILYALNIIDGGVKWSFSTNGAIKSSPLVYNGIVYIGSYDKNIYAIDSVAGSMKWYFNVNGLINCSPAIDNLTGAQINSQISGLTN